MSDCEHCRNHWCCELDYKDKVEHCFFENPTDEYNATFTQEYKYGYQQGRADAIDELFNKKVFNNNTESLFDISLKECRNDFDDGWNRCYHDFVEIAEQLKEQTDTDEREIQNVLRFKENGKGAEMKFSNGINEDGLLYVPYKEVVEQENQIRADAIDELLSKLKPCVFCHDSTDCDIDYFFENCANEDCISWNELKLQAEQLKEQKNE